MFCKMCGNDNPPDALFCGDCGYALNDDEQSTEAIAEDEAPVIAEAVEEEEPVIAEAVEEEELVIAEAVEEEEPVIAEPIVQPPADPESLRDYALPYDKKSKSVGEIFSLIAFICGVSACGFYFLGYCCCCCMIPFILTLLSAIAAVGCGIFGLIKTKAEGNGVSWQAIVGIASGGVLTICSIIGILVAIIFPTYSFM